MIEIEQNKIYNPEEVAEIFEISERVMIEKNEIPFKTIHRKKYITGKKLMEYLDA